MHRAEWNARQDRLMDFAPGDFDKSPSEKGLLKNPLDAGKPPSFRRKPESILTLPFFFVF